MLTWIASVMYENMFQAQLSGGALGFVRFLGFTELLIELILVTILVVVSVISFLDERRKRKEG